VRQGNAGARPESHLAPPESTDRVSRKAGLDGRSGSSNVYSHTAAIMSATVDQPDRQQQATTAKGPSQAVISLNREFRTILVSEEAAEIGRAVAQIVRGDGWYEAKASAVLVSAIVGWLGQDAVQPLGFYANGTGPVEVVAKVGGYIISGRGIETEDDLTRNACERHRARYSQSRLDDMDLKETNSRFTMGSPLAQRTADRLAALLAEEIDPEIARVVLGAL
jgi:hypothetical protein